MRKVKKLTALCIMVAFVMAIATPVWALESAKINLNTATVKELTQLKRIGKKYAERIIKFREENGPFKTVEDIYEVLVNGVPGIKFGLAFCESSGKCLVRIDGNDNELKQVAEKNALSIGCGHSFIVILRQAYPINVLPAIKNIPRSVLFTALRQTRLRLSWQRANRAEG